ncbi:hypothetical protein CAPTEDRAFT_188760 [Capitella teleta]|uniref:Uncharacterized protein n=1 Tax=Capitella teleta TaxID=283909 RepID=R7TDL4_CAPTE|nr:hypothetical protein CAPTEDRAFT_188760 [Capitella teleta]|eukprot:ELT91607.1 hypothetical protein CAPTEDRAFT_188760 [Capitella teleta]
MDQDMCNKTTSFLCGNGRCINATLLCNGYDNCRDGSDESYTYAHCKEEEEIAMNEDRPALVAHPQISLRSSRNTMQLSTGVFKGLAPNEALRLRVLGERRPSRKPYRLSALEVAAIVIGSIIGTVVLCCFLGSVIDCFMHVYKYWCSCLHKAYRSKCRGAEAGTMRNPNFGSAQYAQNSSSEPTVLLVRAVPPSFSTIILSCEGREHQQDPPAESSQQQTPPYRVIGRVSSSHVLLNNNNTIANRHAIEHDPSDIAGNGKLRDSATQTSPTARLACIRTRSCDDHSDERSRLLLPRHQSVRVRCLRESLEFTSIPGLVTEKSPTPDGPMPPSYSSIFRNEFVTYETDGAEISLSPPSR